MNDIKQKMLRQFLREVAIALLLSFLVLYFSESVTASCAVAAAYLAASLRYLHYRLRVLQQEDKDNQ
jgi:Ca2+/Na+ antiporter